MLEEIDFQDSGNQVSVTIDNETQSLPIKKINKLSTYIGLNQSLNTALENNIEVDAFIYYIKKAEEPDIENNEINTEVTQERDYLYSAYDSDIKFLTGVDSNDLKINIDGIVTITIYNGEEIYYIKDVRFKQGHIIDSIANTLPLGTYTMVIQYNGNKYFEESSLTIEFNIEKRLAICELEKERYYGDLLETINISGILKDSERETPINNCLFYYDFNGETKSVTSNMNGEFLFNITIPEPDISHCNLSYELIDDSEFEPGELYEEDAEEEFIDEDGNIRRYSDIEDSDTLYDSEDDNANSITTEDTNDTIINIENYYHETIPNGSLSNGKFGRKSIATANISISDEWSSVGDYSIKSILQTNGWSDWRIDTTSEAQQVTNIKKGSLKLDYKSDKPFKLMLLEVINGSNRYITQEIYNKEGSAFINFDFSRYTGDVTLLCVRMYNLEGNDETTIYIDNITITPEDIPEYPDDIDIEEYYPNASYIINLYTDNESYYFNNTEIEIIVNKAPTHITLDSTNPNTQTNILEIAGSGFATYNNADNDIKYGKINIELPDFNYKHHTINIEKGLFTTDINLSDVYSIYNNSEIAVLEPYDTINIINTSIEIDGDNKVAIGDMFTLEGKVAATSMEGYVKYGILIFNLYDAHEVYQNDTIIYENNDTEPLYRYATEIDRTGIGVFNFNTSQSKKYNIQVEYVGMFGYQGSISIKYPVIVGKAIADSQHYSKTTNCVVDVEDKKFTLSTDNGYGLFNFSNGSTLYDIKVNDVVEFDLINFNGQSSFRLDGTANKNIFTTNGELKNYLTGNNNIKIINRCEEAHIYIDNIKRGSVTGLTSETRKFRIRLENNSTMQIKNLLYYEIG